MVRRLILLLVMLLPLQWSALAVAQARLHGAGPRDATALHAAWHDGHAHGAHPSARPDEADGQRVDHRNAAASKAAGAADAGGDIDPHGCCHACAQAVTASSSPPWPALSGGMPPGVARALIVSGGRDGPFRPPRHPFA